MGKVEAEVQLVALAVVGRHALDPGHRDLAHHHALVRVGVHQAPDLAQVAVGPRVVHQRAGGDARALLRDVGERLAPDAFAVRPYFFALSLFLSAL